MNGYLEVKPGTRALPGRRRRRVNTDWLPYSMMAPAVFVAFAIAIVPLVYSLWLSLQSWYLLRHPTPVWGGAVNYLQLIHDETLWAAFGRTWIWTLGTVLVELVLGIPFALLLNRESAISQTASALILLPWVTPFVVLGFGWRFLLDSEVGPVHAFLKLIGLAGSSSVLNDPVRALAVITVISGWKGMPFMVIAVLAALKSIPVESYEAARVDGANALDRFFYVTVPAVWNTVLIVSLALGILAFYSFDLPWIMTKGGPQDGTTLVGITMYKAVFQEMRPAYAAAISVVMLIVLFLASLLVLLARRSDE